MDSGEPEKNDAATIEDSSSSFKIGTAVEILMNNDDDAHPGTKYGGKYGIIKSIKSDTLIEIEIQGDKEYIVVPDRFLKLVETDSIENNTEQTVPMIDTSEETIEKARSNSISSDTQTKKRVRRDSMSGRSSRSSSFHLDEIAGINLDRGVHVMIRKTNNVEQRAPHLIGHVGIIREIPRHPNTWFQVEFPDNRTFTFRPSAFIRVKPGTLKGDPEYTPLISESNPSNDESSSPKKPSKKERQALESRSFDKGAVIAIAISGKRSKHRLKDYHGMTGIILKATEHKYHVQLDQTNETITTKAVDLRNLTIEEADARNEDMVSKGSHLSKVDPETWVGRRVCVNTGKLEGVHGVVIRSGNGWVQVALENDETTAKRAHELSLVKDPGNSTINFHIPEASDDTKEIESDRRTRRTSGKHSSYAISWIGKSVILPNGDKGIVRKADRGACTVEVEGSRTLKTIRKEKLVLSDDEAAFSRADRVAKRSREAQNRSDVIAGSSHIAAFREQVKRHVAKQMERIKNRPNLKEWKVKIGARGFESGDIDKADDTIVDLVVIFKCNVCNYEKENKEDACWNSSCPACPVYGMFGEEKVEEPVVRLSRLPVPSSFITFSLNRPVKILKSTQLKDSVDEYTYRWLQKKSTTYPDAPAPLAEWAKLDSKRSTAKKSIRKSTKGNAIPNLSISTLKPMPPWPSMESTSQADTSNIRLGNPNLKLSESQRTNQNIDIPQHSQYAKIAIAPNSTETTIKKPMNISSSKTPGLTESNSGTYRPQYESVFDTGLNKNTQPIKTVLNSSPYIAKPNIPLTKHTVEYQSAFSKPDSRKLLNPLQPRTIPFRTTMDGGTNQVSIHNPGANNSTSVDGNPTPYAAQSSGIQKIDPVSMGKDSTDNLKKRKLEGGYTPNEVSGPKMSLISSGVHPVGGTSSNIVPDGTSIVHSTTYSDSIKTEPDTLKIPRTSASSTSSSLSKQVPPLPSLATASSTS